MDRMLNLGPPSAVKKSKITFFCVILYVTGPNRKKLKIKQVGYLGINSSLEI